MKTFVVLFFIILYSPESPQWQGSIRLGEPPVFVDHAIFDTLRECQEAVKQLTAYANGEPKDHIFLMECLEHQYDPNAKGA